MGRSARTYSYEHIFVPSEERVRGAAVDKLYRKREGHYLPVADTGGDHAGRAIRHIMSRQHANSAIVLSQDPDDLVLVVVVQRESRAH